MEKTISKELVDKLYDLNLNYWKTGKMLYLERAKSIKKTLEESAGTDGIIDGIISDVTFEIRCNSAKYNKKTVYALFKVLGINVI